MTSKTYAIATKTPHGAFVRLNLPKMSFLTATKRAEKLRELKPNTTVLVVNTEAY